MKTNVFSVLKDILITFVILSLVVFGLVWFVHTFNVFELPTFIERFFDDDSVDEEIVNHLESNILSALGETKDNSEKYSYVSLTVERAKEFISAITYADEFYWHVETLVTYGGNNRLHDHSIYKKGSRVRIDTVESDTSYTTLIADGNSMTVNNSTGEHLTFGGDTDFSYTSLINVAALESSIEDGYGDINAVSVADRNGEKYLYIEIVKGDVDVRDEFFVSLENGIVMYAASFINDVEYYKQNTFEFDSKSLISDKAFELNDSEAIALLTNQ